MPVIRYSCTRTVPPLFLRVHGHRPEYYIVLMHTIKWLTIQTGKDCRHVLNNARDTGCYPLTEI